MGSNTSKKKKKKGLRSRGVQYVEVSSQSHTAVEFPGTKTGFWNAAVLSHSNNCHCKSLTHSLKNRPSMHTSHVSHHLHTIFNCSFFFFQFCFAESAKAVKTCGLKDHKYAVKCVI